MSGVKESKELLESLNKAVDVMEKVLSDGEVNLLDIKHVLPLIAALKPGLQGAGEIKAELASASADELKELADAGLELALKLVEKLS
jgi:hypothetical protein